MDTFPTAEQTDRAETFGGQTPIALVAIASVFAIIAVNGLLRAPVSLEPAAGAVAVQAPIVAPRAAATPAAIPAPATPQQRAP